MHDTVTLKQQLRSYFDGIGFERWSAIYGQDRLSPIRRSIRDGHAVMLGQADKWLAERFTQVWPGFRALDAGCGTGLFSLMLARRGFLVTGVDIAPQMVEAARLQVEAAGLGAQAIWQVSDVETISGSYEVVACFDVLVHYPAPNFAAICEHLAGLCRDTMVFTYAPYSAPLAMLHRIGGYFPRAHRRTEIQMIRPAEVATALGRAGMRIHRSAHISKGFYHVTLIEARRG